MGSIYFWIENMVILKAAIIFLVFFFLTSLSTSHTSHGWALPVLFSFEDYLKCYFLSDFFFFFLPDSLSNK